MKLYSSEFEPYSIDEAFLDLTGYVSNFNQAYEIAKEIQLKIKKEVGEYLKCSIGLSFTKFLAKFASDTADVDSIQLIQHTDELSAIYSNHKLTDVWGINIRLEKRLNALGIYTLIDLQNYPVSNLTQALGKIGYFLHARINGSEVDSLKSVLDLQSKSIGHSYCLPKQTTDKQYLSAILLKLCSKVGFRLRSRQQVASGIYISWSYISGNSFSKQFKLKKSVFTTDDIFTQAFRVLNQTQLETKIRMLAVGVFNLTMPSSQLELFNHDNSSLTKALDEINNRYGQVIYRGRMWHTSQLAKDRIGFRKVELD